MASTSTSEFVPSAGNAAHVQLGRQATFSWDGSCTFAGTVAGRTLRARLAWPSADSRPGYGSAACRPLPRRAARRAVSRPRPSCSSRGVARPRVPFATWVWSWSPMGDPNWSAAGVLAAMGASVAAWSTRGPGAVPSFLNIILLASVVILPARSAPRWWLRLPRFNRQRLPKRARVYNTAMNVLPPWPPRWFHSRLGGLQAGAPGGRRRDPAVLHVGVPAARRRCRPGGHECRPLSAWSPASSRRPAVALRPRHARLGRTGLYRYGVVGFLPVAVYAGGRTGMVSVPPSPPCCSSHAGSWCSTARSVRHP